MKPDIATTTVASVQAQPVVQSASKSSAETSKVQTPSQSVGLAVQPRDEVDAKEESAPAENRDRLAALVDELNSKAANIARQLRFQFDDDADTSVIEVYDRETEQLIRQIPSEEALKRMRLANGDSLALIDTQA